MIGFVIPAALAFILIALVLAAMIAPAETMTWWAGWADRETEETEPEVEAREQSTPARAYIVYLAGVNVISGDALTNGEKRFLKCLRKRAPGCIIVDDIFPYSPSGRALIGNTRFFEKLWRFIERTSLKRRRRLADLVNLRNIFQVLVAADPRYGPIFNFGAADLIRDGLDRVGYPKDSKSTVIIIGYSGGIQIAAGAAGYLSRLLRAPISIISIGGLFTSTPGIESLASFHHLRGGSDKSVRLGAVIFPMRWKIFARSHWNRLRRAGRVFFHDLPGMSHLGPKGYFGPLRRESNETNFNRTLACVATIIERDLNRPEDRPVDGALQEAGDPSDIKSSSQ